MSYKSDPNTKRLATRCCICNTALRDAKSVEMGIGPTCRKKYGFAAVYATLTERQRKNVNKLIHQAGVACEADDIATILKLADRIEKRGFDMVATKVRTRFITLRIHRATVEEFGWDRERSREYSLGRDHNVVQVWTPWNPDFNDNRKKCRLRGRPCKVVTDFGKFHWEFKVTDGVELMRVLTLTFPGKPMFTDKGVKAVCTVEEFNKIHAVDGVRPIPE
mgnify:CR=1 FL=1